MQTLLVFIELLIAVALIIFVLLQRSEGGALGMGGGSSLGGLFSPRGAADTLTQAVDVMGRVQLGKRFTDDENAKIVAFLKTLTGDQPSFQLPQLPPSADRTPRPSPFD